MKDKEPKAGSMNRRQFVSTVGLGAAGLGAASTGLLAASSSLSAMPDPGQSGFTSNIFPGLQPAAAAFVKKMPVYNGPWTQLPNRPFGGFDFALCYMAEGVQGIDPLSPLFVNGQFSNSSGLFEQYSLQDPQASGVIPPLAADTGQPLAPVPSGVGGNEFYERSVEFWLRRLLQAGLSDRAIADDAWAYINWARRVWGLDFDDPAADGLSVFGAYNYQYPGSPDPANQYSLLSPRIAVAFDADGNVAGYARMAPTLLAPDTAYTVVARAGHSHPNYSGGIVVNGTETRTTAAAPEWPGKVRDGGIWGGVVQPMDVLADIQAVRRGERPFTTPQDPHPPLSGTTPPSPSKRGQFGGSTTTGPTGVGPYWGQWWRRVAPIVGLDVDDIDPATKPSLDAVLNAADGSAADPGDGFRPAARTSWPIGYYPRGTDFFWGNYDLNFGRREPSLPLHYQSEVPTAFRPQDGVPEAFPCDLCPNPGSAEINARADMDSSPDGDPANGGIGLFDSHGVVSGFPDVSNPELDGQMSVGAPGHYGRVHGTSYPRGVRSDGITTYHFRNYLLWPPRLNTTVLGNPTQDNFGNINWTIPTQGDLLNPKDPTGINPPGNSAFN